MSWRGPRRPVSRHLPLSGGPRCPAARPGRGRRRIQRPSRMDNGRRRRAALPRTPSGAVQDPKRRPCREGLEPQVGLARPVRREKDAAAVRQENLGVSTSFTVLEILSTDFETRSRTRMSLSLTNVDVARTRPSRERAGCRSEPAPSVTRRAGPPETGDAQTARTDCRHEEK